jgi:DNA-directed RNA polymerase subunit RPC12/RpoP
MAALLASHRPKKAVYLRGMVTCRKCSAPVYVYKLNALAEEFSVRCAKCGTRGLHARREVTVQELPERRRKPRRD